MDTTEMDAGQSADLAALRAQAADDVTPTAADPGPPGPPAEQVAQVECLFSGAFQLLAGTSTKNALFYTPDRARQAAVMFIPLAESEGWDLGSMTGKWGMRLAFLMVVTPPHAVEFVIRSALRLAGVRQETPDDGGANVQEGTPSENS